jgi:hypothetical protein
MILPTTKRTQQQLTIVRWVGGLGAVTADALARHAGVTVGSARARLRELERAGLLRGKLLLAGEPPLYAATAAGLRASGLRGLQPCRPTVANAPHAIACARAAVALERAYPDQRVMGERELRRDEREAGRALASARLPARAHEHTALHRPDLVLWPRGGEERLPVAVEVELTVKAPRRLAEICRAWARCRCVAGTVYLASQDAIGPLARAIEHAQAGERIALVGLDALALPGVEPPRASPRAERAVAP